MGTHKQKTGAFAVCLALAGVTLMLIAVAIYPFAGDVWFESALAYIGLAVAGVGAVGMAMPLAD